MRPGDLLAVVVVDVLQQHRELVAAHAGPRRRPAAPTASIRPAAATSTASPAAWPARSLIALKSSRSRNSTVAIPAGRASDSSTRRMNSVRFASPVSGSLCASRSSRSSSSEKPACVASASISRTSSSVNVRRRRRCGRRAPSRRPAASRRAPGRSAPARCRARPGSAASSGCAVVAVDDHRVLGVPAERAAASAASTSTIASSAPSSDQRRAQPAVAGQQHDLGRPHAEARCACAASGPAARARGRCPLRQRPRHAVEELQAAMLRALGDVRAVGDRAASRPAAPAASRRAGRARRSSRPPAPRTRSSSDDAEVGAEHPREPARRDPALREPDRAEHEHGRHQPSWRTRRRASRAHTAGPIACARGRQRVQHHRGQRAVSANWARLKSSRVEPVPAREREHDRRADDRRHHEVARIGQQQAEHQRDLRQRQRVRAPAHVRVDDEPLGRPRSRPPAPTTGCRPRPRRARGRGRRPATARPPRRWSRRSALRA